MIGVAYLAVFESPGQYSNDGHEESGSDFLSDPESIDYLGIRSSFNWMRMTFFIGWKANQRKTLKTFGIGNNS
jgi:hypothetical protein